MKRILLLLATFSILGCRAPDVTSGDAGHLGYVPPAVYAPPLVTDGGVVSLAPAAAGGQVLTWNADAGVWQGATASGGSGGGAKSFNIVDLAEAEGQSNLGHGTVANLCEGPTFYVLAEGVTSTGVDFLWWNNGGTTRSLTGRLWNLATNGLLASAPISVSADGRYQVTWAAVPLTAGVEYWSTIGPNDGSTNFVWMNGWLPTQLSVNNAKDWGNFYVFSWGYYHISGTPPPVSPNLGVTAPVMPLLSGI